jgi:hypothetical protein
VNLINDETAGMIGALCLSSSLLLLKKKKTNEKKKKEKIHKHICPSEHVRMSIFQNQ